MAHASWTLPPQTGRAEVPHPGDSYRRTRGGAHAPASASFPSASGGAPPSGEVPAGPSLVAASSDGPMMGVTAVKEHPPASAAQKTAPVHALTRVLFMGSSISLCTGMARARSHGSPFSAPGRLEGQRAFCQRRTGGRGPSAREDDRLAWELEAPEQIGAQAHALRQRQAGRQSHERDGGEDVGSGAHEGRDRRALGAGPGKRQPRADRRTNRRGDRRQRERQARCEGAHREGRRTLWTVHVREEDRDPQIGLRAQASMEEPRSTDRRAAEGRRTALGEPGTRPDTNGEGPRRRRLRLVARGAAADGNARGRGRLSPALGGRAGASRGAACRAAGSPGAVGPMGELAAVVEEGTGEVSDESPACTSSAVRIAITLESAAPVGSPTSSPKRRGPSLRSRTQTSTPSLPRVTRSTTRPPDREVAAPPAARSVAARTSTGV